MILDEPEARLHPDLLAPLARLILKVSARCQIIVGSHAAPLVEDAERPRWTWPSR